MKKILPLQLDQKRDRIILGATIAAIIVIIAVIIGCVSCSRRNNGKQETQSTTESGSQGSTMHETLSETMTETVTLDTETSTETESESETTVEPETVPVPDKPTSSTSHAASPSKDGALQVIGTHLCNASGTPVQLRGISTHGIAWFPSYVNDALFGEFHDDWGVNVMRLAMYSAEYNGYCSGGDKTQLKQLVKNGVSYATNHDMYVIIDWHILNDNDPNTNKTEAISFFKEMSLLYKDYNNVIYEICNEPNGGTSWSQIKSYALEVIPVIKANDPDAVIIVGTPTWSQDVDQAAADPITGYTNIMYTLHYYAATHKDSLRQKMVNAIGAGLPIFVTEYGICDASGSGGIDYDSANTWADTLDKYGISYVAWNLSNKDETSSIIKSGVSKTSGLTQSDLSDSGKWLYKRLTESTGATGIAEAPAPGSSGSNDNSGGNQSGNATQPYVAPTVTPNKITATGSYEMGNSWDEGDVKGATLQITISNPTDKDSTEWVCDIAFNGTVVSVESGWCGVFTVNGNTIHIENADHNGVIPAGGTASGIGCNIKFRPN